MEESTVARDAVLAFYEGINSKAVERFDDIVSASPATLVIGTAPGEWVMDRARLRFGFEAEGLTIEAGPNPTGYREGSMGWFVDEPWYGFPGGGGMRTRLTGIVVEEDGRWKIAHLHVSVGVPDEEVQELQARWASPDGRIGPRQFVDKLTILGTAAFVECCVERFTPLTPFLTWVADLQGDSRWPTTKHSPNESGPHCKAATTSRNGRCSAGSRSWSRGGWQSE